jgi:hypothetical protein
VLLQREVPCCFTSMQEIEGAGEVANISCILVGWLYMRVLLQRDVPYCFSVMQETK